MFELTLINFNKKLSFLSLIFMILSIVIVYFICVYNASFELSEYYLLDQRDIVVGNYLTDTLQMIEFIGVIFIILLVELELFYNTDNFDSYFVVLKGKTKYFIAKITSYLIIIFLYTVILFLGFILIYIIRFKSMVYIQLIYNCFACYFLYFLVLFLVSYFVMILFKNYYSVILTFLYYWATKIIENKNSLLKIILPKLTVDIENNNVAFECNVWYLLLFVGILYIINMYIYKDKDMKVHS